MGSSTTSRFASSSGLLRFPGFLKSCWEQLCCAGSLPLRGYVPGRTLWQPGSSLLQTLPFPPGMVPPPLLSPSVHLCAPLHPLSLGGCSGSLSRSQGLWFHPAFSLAAPTTVHAQASDSPGQEMRKGRVCDRLHSLRSQAVLAGPSSGPVMTALVGNCMHLLVMGNRGEMTPVCSSHTLLHSIYSVCRL